MQFVEFFDRDHFENDYFRMKPKPALSKFIDFMWETDFDELYERHPAGFSDVLFPNVGYTYLINLGTPFVMRVGEAEYPVKTDGFLPRHKEIEGHHCKGNKLFGIKFRISPVIFQKEVDFSEYKQYIFPLSYLIDREVVAAVKLAKDFSERANIVSDYYEKVLSEFGDKVTPVNIVAGILDDCYRNNLFDIPIEELAEKNKITTRTLQRYFEAATSLSSKQVLQIMRIRKAVADMIADPEGFNFSNYGYYDHSHFSKHLKQFMGKYAREVSSNK